MPTAREMLNKQQPLLHKIHLTPTCLEARGSERGVVQQPREVLGLLGVRVFLDLSAKKHERKKRSLGSS